MKIHNSTYKKIVDKNNNLISRKCNDCGIMKKIAKFGIRGISPSTLKPCHISYCKSCMIKRSMKYRKSHPEEYNHYQKIYSRKLRLLKKLACNKTNVKSSK